MALNRWRLLTAAKAWLVLASLFFYSYWNPAYLWLIVASLLVNYAIGTALTQPKPKTTLPPKLVLCLGVAFNLGLLLYYKYTGFLLQNLNGLLSSPIDIPTILLPLAISFFTFQQVAYLVDCYQKRAQEYDFLNYTLFVTFFPQLIAGPIVHHQEMMPQFQSARKKVFNPKLISLGLFTFFVGLSKKVLIADTFADVANYGFAYEGAFSFIESWLIAYAYGFQIYYDFSGYTDMALGLAFLFNIRLPLNFDTPYRATTLQDFWRRWHMTLSRFLRDYVYIPLGGNRNGQWLTYQNLFLTFLIGGIWHGAAWTFVIWGALHGAGLVLQRLWQKLNIPLQPWVAGFITFHYVMLAWVFFRATSLDSAFRLVQSMVGLNGLTFKTGLPNPIQSFVDSARWFPAFTTGDFHSDIYLILLVVFLAITVLIKQTDRFQERFHPTPATILLTLTLAILGLSQLSQVSEFLYFNF
ncbi:MAG: MBOAT family protein [Vampirovibrio sp.]|nr:MBOAT family protein [Vampirovibrio sp.]